MATPEGLVKTHVKKVLDGYKPALYAHWPVQNGMGSPTLDCVGAYKGRAFAIETKAPGKKPTARQAITILAMKAAGYMVFVIDCDESIAAFRHWVAEIDCGGT